VTDRHLDLTAERAANLFDHLGEPQTFDAFAVDLEDDITGHDPGLERRAAVDRGDDLDRTAFGALVKLDSDALEAAFQQPIEILLPRRRNVHRERIELPEHALHRPFSQLGFIDRLDIVAGDLAVNVNESADEGVIIVALPQAPGELEGEQGQQND